MRPLLHLRVAIVTLAATGCIAFVQPIDVGDHCTIQGETTCAACIRTNCQPQVDTCCGARACGLGLTDGLIGGIAGDVTSDVLEVVDRCGVGDSAACASRLGKRRSGAEEEAVRACVASACTAECLDGDDTAIVWTCDRPRDSKGECGACLYANCEDALDDCCSDATCSGDPSIHDLVGGCAVAEDPALCSYRYPKVGASGVAGVVTKCMATSCAAACFGDGRSHTRCDFKENGSYCACADAAQSSGPTCAKSSDTECVLWNGGCTCGSYGCSQTSTGCSCRLGASGPGATCAPSSVPCCVFVEDGRSPRCACDSDLTSCSKDLGEYEVADCAESTFLEKVVNLRVESCSN